VYFVTGDCNESKDNNVASASVVINEDIAVVKVESVSDGCGERSCNKEQESGGACCTDTWVKVHDISLTFEDKHILEQGDKVIDKHINCAK